MQAFVERGVLKYRVLGIKGVLPRDKLPKRYVESAPSFWLTKTGKTLKLFDGRTLSVNGIYRKSTFEKFMMDIDVAGDRLHFLNQHIEDVRAEFEGIRTMRSEFRTPRRGVKPRSRFARLRRGKKMVSTYGVKTSLENARKNIDEL